MFRKLPAFLTRMFERSSSADELPDATVIPRDQHPISRKQISRAALDVLYGLHKAGFEAWLVGGCLRDILTGSEPKDFDVVTNATPEQVHEVFRRSRIIGRRFRLVHVRFGRDVIEVATFRALNSDGEDRHHSDHGQILRDNVFGDIQEDALRRDFTINALYYNIADFTLHDFVGSMKDIEARRIRLIGDPDQRYREDPVRMLRAARFAAKLDFELDPATEAPIKTQAELLHNVPPARLFDEVLKAFLTGHALRSWEILQHYGLFDILFPETARVIAEGDETAVELIRAAMINTDRRIERGRPVTPAFLYGVFLWPAVRARIERHRNNGMAPAEAMHKATSQVIAEQVQVIAIPRRFSSVMREIWEQQPRLARRAKRAQQIMENPRFRASYDFLLLREQAGEIEPGLGDWWTRYQEVSPDERLEMLRELQGQPGGKAAEGEGGKRRRKRRPRRRKSSAGAGPENPQPASQNGGGEA